MKMQKQQISRNGNDIITVKTVHGTEYQLPAEAVIAAHHYIEHRIMLEKAERHLNDYVFGTYDLSSLNIRDANWYIERFKSRFGFSYEDAKGLYENFIDRFITAYDETIDDYSLWRNAIRDVCLEQHVAGYCANKPAEKESFFIPDFKKPENP